MKTTRLNPLAAVLLGWLMAGCAMTPARPDDPALARCLDLYAALDDTVARQGTTPSSPQPIAGFPHLRVNRFLASYRELDLDAPARQAWLKQLGELGSAARAVEIASLPDSIRSSLGGGETTPLPDALAACSSRLQRLDLAAPERFALIRERAEVPDDYCTLPRIVGLYPLTALPVQAGIADWHDEARRTFALALDALPVRGEVRRFQPPSDVAPAVPLATLGRDVLDIPLLDERQLAALFSTHAPVWEIDVAGEFDKPGAPFRRADGTPSVDTGQPVSYRYPSYTRWQGRVVLQLNYVVWFSERPLTGAFDILGGALDGLIWRVTLDAAGNPLIYDSIHNCGCYQQYFPSPSLRLRREALALAEPPLVPRAAPDLKPGQRLVIRLASASHYIQRIYADAPSGSVYAWRAYEDLYAVPGGERGSLFDRDGLVAGTERGERWLLWPMGVPSPGAMRERGRHATAFVGRRHFDDADLLERLFEPIGTTPAPPRADTAE